MVIYIGFRNISMIKFIKIPLCAALYFFLTFMIYEVPLSKYS